MIGDSNTNNVRLRIPYFGGSSDRIKVPGAHMPHPDFQLAV